MLINKFGGEKMSKISSKNLIKSFLVLIFVALSLSCTTDQETKSAPPAFLEIGKTYLMKTEAWQLQKVKVLELGKNGWAKVEWAPQGRFWLNTDLVLMIQGAD
jgi:hypothetical protein